MITELNQNVSQMLKRLGMVAIVAAGTATALTFATSAQAVPLSGTTAVQAQTLQSTSPNHVQDVKLRVLKVKRARRIGRIGLDGTVVSGAACWVTFEKYGTVFYQSCPY